MHVFSTSPSRLAVISAHTSPLARLGGYKTGGMNVYVRETAIELGRRGHAVDVFTRDDGAYPEIVPLAPGVRVVHLAATLTSSSEANPLRTIRVNCEGTINVFDAALALGLSKVVWASSVAVFGAAERQGEHIANDAYHAPLGLYGAVKSMNERLGVHYQRRRGLALHPLAEVIRVYPPVQRQRRAGQQHHEQHNRNQQPLQCAFHAAIVARQPCRKNVPPLGSMAACNIHATFKGNDA